MRILIQRVSSASVIVEGRVTGSIGQGLLAFVGIRESDTVRELEWMIQKLVQLRIFEDEAGKMNLSVEDTRGSILVVSQFTLYGDAKKGNRPNFLAAARPETAKMLYDEMLQQLARRLGEDRVASGVFQAMMKVELVNDGPVTILLEKEAELEGKAEDELAS